MSHTHYKVNDDIYGKIMKPQKQPSPVESEYAEVFQACNGLGTYIYHILSLLITSSKLASTILVYLFSSIDFESLICY